MSDIFISYKREEQPLARRLADALEQEGWSVWWDPKLRAGEYFDDAIEQALNAAKCVIVLWSKLAVKSEYVKAEATEALEQKKLVPVKIEDVNPPFRFKRVHTVGLIKWDGSKDSVEFRKLVEDLASFVRPVVIDTVMKKAANGAEAGGSFDTELKDIAKSLILANINDPGRQLHFDLRVQAALNRLALSGLGNSDAIVTALTKVCMEEAKDRLNAIWTMIKRVLRESHIEFCRLNDEVLQEFDSYLPLALTGPKEVMERHINNAGMGFAMPDVADLAQPAISKFHGEIRLFVASVNPNHPTDDRNRGRK
jgi:hypothetical protein